MKKILLVSGQRPEEKQYARMLELELSRKGFDVIGEGETASFSAEIMIFDEAAPETAESLGGEADGAGIPVICCAKTRRGVLPANMIYFERPLDIERFCGFISIITDKGRQVAQLQKGFAGDIMIDTNSGIVTCRGERIELTSREYELLLYLYRHRGEAVSRDQAIRDVWEFGYTGDTNVVDVYIRYLRKKLDERFDAKFIVTVRGQGYMLR